MNASAVRIRSAFREAALGLMEWQEPPEVKPRDEWSCPDAPPFVYRSFDPQGDVEPFNVEADWEEKN